MSSENQEKIFSPEDSRQRKRRAEEDLLIFWDEHVPPAYRNIIDPAFKKQDGNGWTWDEQRQAYRSSTGTWLDDDLIALAILFGRSLELQFEQDTANMLRGEMAVEAWRDGMLDNLWWAYTCSAALAVGGLDNITDIDYRTIEGIASTDNRIGFGMADARIRLAGFAQELQDKDAGSNAQIINRSGLYAESTFTIFEHARWQSHARALDEKGNRLFTEMRNVLDPMADHCQPGLGIISCPEESAKGWVSIDDPTFTLCGSRQCGPRCRCFMLYR